MLEIRDLVKVYPGPVAALQGVQLNIPKGMFGLLGPNGSGKTTLMRILAGLLQPTSGEVFFHGQSLTRQPELIWPRLGYLPQAFGFYPNLTGEAMLIHLLRLKGIHAPSGVKPLCADLLERVNLTFAAKRKVKGYSGGMRQRLGIAQAIAGNPELLIVDEPTAGLDPEERVRFYRLLAELAEERVVLLSTHIVEDVSMLCSRFAVIRHGHLLVQTTPGQACADLEGCLFEGMVSNEDLEALSKQVLITRTHLSAGRNIVRLYAPNGRPPEGFDVTESSPTLEDAYFVLTHGESSSENPPDETNTGLGASS